MSSTENDIPMVNWEDTDSTATKNDISMGPRDDTESNTDRSFPENVELSTTCAELLRKTSPDAINFGPLTCGLGALSTKTKLAFRLEQRYSWDIETPGVAFDVWRPAFIWGVDLEQLSTNPGKFYHKDLILAKPRDSWQAAKDDPMFSQLSTLKSRPTLPAAVAFSTEEIYISLTANAGNTEKKIAIFIYSVLKAKRTQMAPWH
ncbi:hypothetical protein N7470_006930 [Penicillium chermesinum]|nr:hypothetical protein N7470_006930 [Penicillium chermesinum]